MRFFRSTGEFNAVILITEDRALAWELKRDYNELYPDFRYEVFWPERPIT